MDDENQLFLINVAVFSRFLSKSLQADLFSKYLECNICMQDLNDAFSTKCGHVFCRVSKNY